MRENKKGNAELAPHKASDKNKPDIGYDCNWNCLSDEQPATIGARALELLQHPSG